MSDPIPFSGFPPQSIQFLTDLQANNNRLWFEEHKYDFEKYIQTPAKQFANSMSQALETISSPAYAHLPVHHSIFRIHRDLRFSKDKTPYKTHLGIWFWQGNRPKMENSGYYFHLEAHNLRLGIGIYNFPKPYLNTYRQAVIDPELGPELIDAIQTVLDSGPYSLGGKHYKRVPRGFDPEHEHAELLLHNGLYAGTESEIPADLHSSKLVGYCLTRYRDMLPIHAWLMDVLELIEP